MSFCLVFDIDMLRNIPYAIDMLRNISYTTDKLRNISFVIDMLWNVPYGIDMLRNNSYAIDKLRYVSFVIDMLQLLYAPSVMNQLCMIEMIIVILHLMILRLWLLIFCLVFWNFISLEIALFWQWICWSLAKLYMLTPLLYKFFRIAYRLLKC